MKIPFILIIYCSLKYPKKINSFCYLSFYPSYVPRLPKEGETIHGTRFCTGFGGKGANQCVAARRLGCSSVILAKLGKDSWGADYLQQLKKEGICTDYIEIMKEESTGVAQICVSADGANQIVIVVGANNCLSIKDVEENQDLLSCSKVLLCQLETPISTTIRTLELFKGKTSIVNAAPALEETPPELMKLAGIFCVNELEASLMTKLPCRNVEEAKEACAELKRMGCNTVVITMGAIGAVFQEQNSVKVYHVKIQKVDNVIDTTGAGDGFIGALAYFLTRDTPLGESIGQACVYASLSVQTQGTQSSFATEIPEGNSYELLEI